MMPDMQGVEEARHFVQQAMDEERQQSTNIGNELDPEQEQEIEECQDIEEILHPDFVQVNPDNQEFEKNLTQVRKTIRSIELKSPDEILKAERDLDEFQKKH